MVNLHGVARALSALELNRLTSERVHQGTGQDYAFSGAGLIGALRFLAW